MTQNTSLANFALTQEQAFTINPEKDNALTQAGKFTFATAITTGSFALAVAETALSAIAQIALLPLWIISREGYSQIGKHTSDSAATMVLAAKRTFGMDKTKETDDSKTKKSLGEKLKEVAIDLSAKVHSGKDYILATGKEHKRAVIATALTASLAALYFFYPEGLLTDMGKGLEEYATWSLEKTINGTSYVGTKLGQGATYIGNTYPANKTYDLGISIRNTVTGILPRGAPDHNGELVIFDPIQPEFIKKCKEEGMWDGTQVAGTSFTTGLAGVGLSWLVSNAQG